MTSPSCRILRRLIHSPSLSRQTQLWKSPSTKNTRSFASLSSQTSSVIAAVETRKENEGTSKSILFAATAAAASLFLTGVSSSTNIFKPQETLMEKAPADDDKDDDDDTTTVMNWSGTHSVNVPNDSYYEPETVQELEQIVQECHRKGKPIRPIGSALSPNAIGFREAGMVSLANLDKIIKVDKENMTVTVQAGARVSQVIDALRSHGLTLPNLASIAEQQMGGFTQVGAHGTGAKIAPVDHYVTSLKLVTPAKGTIELNEKDDGELFHLAKVGLGCLGIVSEVTMKCVKAHNLVEHTFVLTRSEAKSQLNRLLKRHKHLRYMWLPYTDFVVAVTNNPEGDPVVAQQSSVENDASMSSEEKFQPLTDLLAELTKNEKEPFTKESMHGMGFGELRDALLAINPLNVEHVKRCNQAEAEFWKRNEGYQTKPSDQLLQFDCGGQQWVWEVCFPTGTYGINNGNDMEFMENLLAGIEEKHIAAHSPIEQRWTASSSSLMSPAHGPPKGLFSWVGIIMYLPSEEEKQRRDITEKFKGEYCDIVRDIGHDVQSVSHWAKQEMPPTVEDQLVLKELMRLKYPVELFKSARKKYDPKNILSNGLIDAVLGKPFDQNN